MVPKKYTYKFSFGIFYYRDPEKTVHHRERGLPAYASRNGDKTYQENCTFHRLDGFAGDWKYRKAHFLNGKLLFTKKNK